MPDSTTPPPESDFVCDCEEGALSACVGERFYKEHEGQRYCVLHFPSKEKTADFEAALQKKASNDNSDFGGVWFPDKVSFSGDFNGSANFRGATFSASASFEAATFNAHADFERATFSAAADFSNATFGGVTGFIGATFSASARFAGATFSASAHFSFANFREETRFAGATFSAEAYFEGATFSREVRFNGATFSAEAYFEGAIFSAAADFESAIFSAKTTFYGVTFRANVSFMLTTFSAEAIFFKVTFRDLTIFSLATFRAKAEFGFATFSGKTVFDGVTFGAEASFFRAKFTTAASFELATFSVEASFNTATFSGEVDFNNATFSALVDFYSATFADHVRFAGDEKHQVFTHTSRLDLQFARIEKPDRVWFHTLSLRPHWFVNIDARKFGFTNVNWVRLDINEEISHLEQNDISSPHHLVAIACRNLAVNAEENHRYEEASKFRYMAMEARRLESWRGLSPWRLSWWYWLASGYGERVLRAFLMLLAVLALFAVLYMTTTGGWEAKGNGSSTAGVKPTTNFPTALTYSAGVMTLQKPEPRPITPATQTLVLLETILGPLQAALLALAIRRKFMR